MALKVCLSFHTNAISFPEFTSFGQLQDTELWNNQFPDSKILEVPVSQCVHALVYMASRDVLSMWICSTKTFNTYILEKLGKSDLAFKEVSTRLTLTTVHQFFYLK